MSELSRLLLAPALASAPRALGLEDRESASATYGCFDRVHWHYALSDFPSAWFGAGSYFLAQLFICNFPDNKFQHNARVRDWALAAVAFLAKSAHRDGSLAEVYPFERSYCATAFAALHAALALELLGEKPPERLRATGRWLAKAKPGAASNQLAACAAALAGLGKLFQDESLTRASDERALALERALTHNGVFPEYGDLDLGYQTVTLSCLAQLARLRPERASEVEALAKRAQEPLRERLRDDATYEWRTTSRRTQFVYALGLVRFAPDLAARLERGLAANRAMTPLWLDDRYFLHLATDFLEAARLAS